MKKFHILLELFLVIEYFQIVPLYARSSVWELPTREDIELDGELPVVLQKLENLSQALDPSGTGVHFVMSSSINERIANTSAEDIHWVWSANEDSPLLLHVSMDKGTTLGDATLFLSECQDIHFFSWTIQQSSSDIIRRLIP